MIQELRHRIYPFPTRGTAWDHDAVPTIGHGRWILDKVVEGVASDLALERTQQVCFLHV